MGHSLYQSDPKRAWFLPSRLVDLVLRICAFALLWGLLNGPDAESWLMGVPVVVLATGVSTALVPLAPWRVSVPGLLLFIFYFGRKSLLSSIDVASRVFQPQIPLHPGIMRYRLRLKESGERVLMANTTSLLPGTLSVGLEADELVIHALDVHAPINDEVKELEVRIAAIFGIHYLEEVS